MIPKIIHYIWFGRGEYPEKVKECIDSWKRYLPDYKYMLWNEDTFDVNANAFTREAYAQKKYAFVSDYVRLCALSKYGGIYMDTDMEILKPVDPFLKERLVLGTDDLGHITAFMATEANHPLWKALIDRYSAMKFINDDGSLNMVVNNIYIEEQLAKYGYRVANEYQSLQEGIKVYPDQYFHVLNFMNGERHITSNSYAIHWHTLTWLPRSVHWKKFIRNTIMSKVIGPKNAEKLAYWLHNHLKNEVRFH